MTTGASSARASLVHPEHLLGPSRLCRGRTAYARPASPKIKAQTLGSARPLPISREDLRLYENG